MFKKFLLLTLSVLYAQLSFAQGYNFLPVVKSNPTYSTYLAGLATPPYNDTLPLTKGSSYDRLVVNPSSTGMTIKSIQDYILLGINHDTNLIVPAYQYAITLKILKYSYTTGTVSSSPTIVMKIAYDPDSLKSYNDLQVYKFGDVHAFAVVVTNIQDISGTTPTTVPRTQLAKNFFIETAVSTQRYNDSTIYIYPVSSKVDSNLHISWTTSRTEITSACPTATGNELQPVEFDLEWTYIDDYQYDLSTGTESHPFETATTINYDFRRNATRVRLQKNSFDIPLIYERGAIVYRLRAVRPNNASKSYRDIYYQDWTLSDVGSCSTAHNCRVFVITTAHKNDKLNWQYSINFAEEGKYKHVINYFDGSLKNRQTQTKINTDQSYIIAVDKMYDFEGNKSLETLPIPVLQAGLGYHSSIARSSATNKQYAAADFDNISCASPDSFSVLSTGSQARIYYSSANTDKNGYQKFVPDAKGFPLMQSIYSPDKKLLWQSGAGLDHQLWTKHGTRYEYTRANQAELDLLFGSEAGLYQYYPKTITTDPNGQTSFAITNLAGQTVATGLIGLPDTSETPIIPIQTDDTGASYCFNILGNGAQDRLPDGLGISTNFYVEKTANHKLQYRIKQPGFPTRCGSTLWAKAYYEYSSTDECGRIVIPKTVGVLGYDTDTSNAVSEAYFSSPESSEFLEKGKYYVEKKLTFKKTEINNRVRLFIKENEPVCFHDEKWYVRSSVDSTDFPCVTTPPLGPCDLRKKQMLQDLWPGGKYGMYDKNSFGSFRYDTVHCVDGSLYIYPPVNKIIYDSLGNPIDTVTANPNSIFTSVWFTGVPCIQALLPGMQKLRYQQCNVGMPDTVVKNGRIYTNIVNLPVDTFIYIFNDEMAEALLPSHPEYCKLGLCDDGAYIAELESRQTFKQAEIANRFYLDSIIVNDPLYLKTDPADRPYLKYKLSRFRTLPDTRLDILANEQAYCAAGNAQEVSHCLKFMYPTEVQNVTSFINDEVKQKYYTKMQSLYMINRATVLQQMMDSLGNTCEPCLSFRMTLIEPAIFKRVFDTTGGFDSSLGVPGWIDSIFVKLNDPSFNMANLQLPSQLNDSINNIRTALDTARADAIMLSLQNCSVVQSDLLDIRNKLIDGMVAGNPMENPIYIQGAIVQVTGVKLTDLCNGYLPNLKEFNTTNELEYTYDCERPEFYEDVRAFLNRLEVHEGIKDASLVGGAARGFYLDADNTFENRLATALTCGTSDSVIIQGFLDTIQTSVSTHLEFVKLKLKKYVVSGPVTEKYLYIYNKVPSEPQLHGDPSVTLDALSANCINDDLGKSLSEGLLGKHTVITRFSVDDGMSPTEQDYYMWSQDISFMGSSDGKLPINCITCIDVKNALKDGFNANYDTGNMNVFNHPLMRKTLTNFLNFKLNVKYTYEDYYELLKACAISDSIMIDRYFATMKIECSTKTVADTFIARLSRFSGRELVDFRYQYLTGGVNIIGVNFDAVPVDSLQYYKHQISTIATNASCTTTYLPKEPLKVFVKDGCTPTPAMNTYADFGTPMSVYYYLSKKKFLLGKLYTRTSSTYTSPKAHADMLAAMYNAVSQCSESFVIADGELLRNEQYGTTYSQEYLSYIYGLDGHARHEIRDSISTDNLVNIGDFAGNELKYDDPYCTNSIRDLYIYDKTQGAHSGSVQLNSILNAVKAILDSNKLFLPDGALTGGTGGTRIFRKASGVHWYRYFDGNNNLFNVHLQPPAYPPYDLNTLRLDSMDIGPGKDSIYRFTAYMHYSAAPGEVIACKGYTDFTLGYGEQLANVVLYDKPGLDFCLDSIDCEYSRLQDAITMGKVRYIQAFNDSVANMTEQMFTFMMDNVRDSLFLCAANQKNMITLYYYDLNGNLVRTVPPAGIKTSLPHAKATSYEYDSRNLVTKQNTPDAGETRFFYDMAGRLVFSQNNKQKNVGRFSYTLYDAQSRATETGEVALTTAWANPPVFVTGATDPYLFPMDTLIKYVKTRTRYDVVISTYDTARFDLGAISGEHLSTQENLINRVSSIAFYPSKAPDYNGPYTATPEFETFYSYDLVGNVKTVTFDCIAMSTSKQRYKRVDYDYDQLSGKVNMISYNRSRGDQFYQEYDYDADNRITCVKTSNDGIIWNRDATYRYYKHGPLANARIGNQKIQSVDYAYTIQGWLKAINGDVLRWDKGMIGDSAIVPNYARDVIAHTLNYYKGDYQAINSAAMIANFAEPDRSLYNGNITRTNTAIMGLGNQRGTYTYDQAHRLVGAAYTTVDESNLTVNSPTALYKNSYVYDYDGNLKTLVRYDGNAVRIDSMIYNYRNNLSNRLINVDDKVATTGGEDFQPGQIWGNYVYDTIGNLIQDSQAHLKMDWNLYGKLRTVEHTTSSPREKVSYYYDGLGNRVRKVNGKSITGVGDKFEGDYYVRDAAGNILATYRVNSTYSKIKLIAASNDGIRTAPAFPTFVNLRAASIGDYITAFSDRAILDMPSWVAAQTDKPISFYLSNAGSLYSEIMVSALAPDYLNDIQQYSIDNSGMELFSTAFINLPGSMHMFINEVLMQSTEGTRMFRHFDELMPEAKLDEMWENLAVGSTRTPSAHVANANTLYNWMTMNTKYAEVGTAMVDLMNYNIEHEGATETRNFVNTMMHDDIIYESANLRSELPNPPTQFENYTREMLYSGGNMSDVLGFFDQWGTPATDWLTANTTENFRMETVYVADADNVLSDWLGNVGDATVIDEILAGVDGLEGIGYLNDRQTATWVQEFGPVDMQSLYVDAVVADTTELAEHHIYGSSRLGVQKYDTGSMRQVYNITGGTLISKLSDPTVWYSYIYADLIKKDQKQPYGQEFDGANDTMRVNRTLGFRHYEMTDHLGNVLASVLDRKYGVDTGNGATTYAWYHPEISSSQDYYPFGMRMGERHNEINDTAYRFGYNGMEKDNEKYGAFKHYDFGARIYDPRMGRFLSMDPKSPEFPSLTAYAFAANKPIVCIDEKGEGPRYKAIAYALETQLNSIGVREGSKGQNNYTKTVTDNEITINVQITMNNEILKKSFVFNSSTDDKGVGYNTLRGFGANMYDATIATEDSWVKRAGWMVKQLDNEVNNSPLEGAKLTFSFWATLLTFGEGAALVKSGSWLSKGLLAADIGLASNQLSKWFMADNASALEKMGISKKQLQQLEAVNNTTQFLKGVKDLVSDVIKSPNADKNAINFGKTIISEISLMQSVNEVMQPDKK